MRAHRTSYHGRAPESMLLRTPVASRAWVTAIAGAITILCEPAVMAITPPPSHQSVRVAVAAGGGARRWTRGDDPHGPRGPVVPHSSSGGGSSGDGEGEGGLLLESCRPAEPYGFSFTPAGLAMSYHLVYVKSRARSRNARLIYSLTSAGCGAGPAGCRPDHTRSSSRWRERRCPCGVWGSPPGPVVHQ